MMRKMIVIKNKEATNTEWDMLVINKELETQIDEIRTWLNYNKDLVNEYDPEKRFPCGYRALFYGPSGTGKTFTAKLLGRQFDKDVYKD